MRPNRYVILVSVLLGSIGLWLTADAVGQYLNTVRSFAAVEITYVEDSFVWQDPEHEEALSEFVVRNDSENVARLTSLRLNLYFDGEFAGARYEPWEAIDIPARDEVTVEVPFLVSIESLRPEGSEAELTVRGDLRLEFEGIERDMTVQASTTIGRVPYEED